MSPRPSTIVTALKGPAPITVHGGQQIARIACCLFAALAILVIAPQLSLHPKAFPVDFNYLWAAGQLWLNVESPYFPQYNEFLTTSGIPQYQGPAVPFFYPPNAILFIAPLGFLSYKSAWIAFTFANCAALVFSSILFARLAKHAGAAKTLVYPFLLHVGVIGAAWSASRLVFAYNAPMLITYLAVMMVLYGAVTRRSVLFIIGLTLALMKPQIGIALGLACLLSPALRRDTLIAGVITATAALIGLLPGGVNATMPAFLNNVAAYKDFYPNLTQHTSGLGFAIHTIAGVKTGALFALAAMTASICGGLVYAARKTPPSQARDIAFIIFALAAAALFLPSHNNYYITLTPVLFWLVAGRRGFETLLWIPGAALAMRGWDLAIALKDTGPESLLFYISATDTIAVMLIFSAVMIKFMREFGWGRSPVPQSANHEPVLI